MGQPCIRAPLKACCIKAKDMKITFKEEKDKIRAFSKTLSVSRQHLDLGYQHRFILVLDSAKTQEDMRTS